MCLKGLYHRIQHQKRWSFAHLGLAKLYPSTSTLFNYFPERQKAIALQGVAGNLHKTSHYRARTQGTPSRKRAQPFMQSHVRHSLYKAEHRYNKAVLLKRCPEKMRKLVQWRFGHLYFFFSDAESNGWGRETVTRQDGAVPDLTGTSFVINQLNPPQQTSGAPTIALQNGWQTLRGTNKEWFNKMFLTSVHPF